MRSFQEILSDVCLRPEMYVVERRFKTVAAWLDGYSSGLSQGKNTTIEAVALDDFRLWLSEKFGDSHHIERNLVWWAYLVRLYPEDEEALKQLPVLYDEFVSHLITEK